ncbi:MAG: DUF4241 domain-containing protein [Planctomycetes bacterium]|nr:DUF4241 domain-containing protein [Planctomycetota bacterium]
MAKALYAKAFLPRHVLCDFPGRETWLSGQRAGDLRVVSGAIVVADAQDDAKPRSPRLTLAPGEYPVLLSMWHGNGTSRTACARVDVSTLPAVDWKRAGTVGVTCGAIAFRDAACLPIDEAAGDVFSNADRTLVGVASGWGDGNYPCWLGVGSDGAPACLLVDFGNAVEQRWQIMEFPWPPPVAGMVHPLLTRRQIAVEPLDRWKSTPLDRSRDVAIDLRSPDIVALEALDISLVDGQGRAVAVEREELKVVEGDAVRWLVRLRCPDALPTVPVLRLATLAAERRLR